VRIHIHCRDEILGLFDGPDLAPPGVVSVRGYGGRPAPHLKARTAAFPGGVARKP
jgi:hypothetical protein